MTLTQASYLFKKGVFFGSIILLILIASFFSYRIWYVNFYLPGKESLENTPDAKFGILPKLPLPKSKSDSSKYEYSIDTQTGNLPSNFPKIVKVYFIPQIGTTLLASSRAKELAQKLNFNQDPQVLSPILYKFSDSEDGELVINLNSGNFYYKRKLPDISQNQDNSLPEPEKLAQEFKNYLSNKNLLKTGLAEGKVFISFDKGTRLESSFAYVSIIPSEIEKIPVVTPEFNKGLVKVTMTKAYDAKYRFLELDYTYWEKDSENFSTYPIKDLSFAFEQLKSGKGTVVIEPNSKKISLSNIYLAYFMMRDYFEYLEPVYVFEGENFVSFVPAIEDQYLEQN